MICPYCERDDDKVIDSRGSDAGRSIRRRRECQKCSRRFTTFERVEKTSRLMVVKRDGSRVPFDPEKVLRDLLRIGKSVIISIPNFGYWKVRTKLLFFGKMPVTKTLPNTWYNTPNLHMCSIKDLFNFCDEKNINIKKVVGINEDQTSLIRRSNLEIKNLFSKLGIFLIG